MPQKPACSLSSVSDVPRECFDALAASKDADLPGAEIDLGCGVHMCGQQADLVDTIMCFERIREQILLSLHCCIRPFANESMLF